MGCAGEESNVNLVESDNFGLLGSVHVIRTPLDLAFLPLAA